MSCDTDGFEKSAVAIVKSYNAGTLSKHDAVAQTNDVFRDMTALRLWVFDMQASTILPNLWNKLDERMEAVMQELATNLANAIQKQDGDKVTFVVKGNGLTI
jgi:hypothetical protein